jgi:hypothetical protein
LSGVALRDDGDHAHHLSSERAAHASEIDKSPGLAARPASIISRLRCISDAAVIDDFRPLASISSRRSFVCVAVSETLQQLRYEQQWFSALIQWERQPLPCSGEESGEGASYATWHQSAAECVSS